MEIKVSLDENILIAIAIVSITYFYVEVIKICYKDK